MDLKNKFLNSVVIAKRGRQIKDREEESALDHNLKNPILIAIDELKSGKITVEIHDELKLGRNHDDDDLDMLYSNLKVKEEVEIVKPEIESELDFAFIINILTQDCHDVISNHFPQPDILQWS